MKKSIVLIWIFLTRDNGTSAFSYWQEVLAAGSLNHGYYFSLIRLLSALLLSDSRVCYV